MVWISLLLAMFSTEAAELQKFLTKHPSETLRYISQDGRYAYIQKKPGVLGLVTSFRSIDFLAESNANDFLVKGSRFKTRLAIESIPNSHEQMSLVNNNEIYVVDYGNTVTRKVGQGRSAKLHLRDEWITYYNALNRVIHVQNLITQKKFEIKLAPKPNPFFVPEVEMVSSKIVTYTDINAAGYSALVSYDLETLKSNIIYKSSQSGTRLELCQSEDYLGLGEFPYDGALRGSKIQTVKTTGSVNLASFSTHYSSIEQDIGNMICLPHSIYFVKTMNQDKELNFKVTEAVKLDIKTENVEARSNLKAVAQLIEMEGRVLIPMRGEFYVLEGISNIGEDTLKNSPSKEELQIDL